MHSSELGGDGLDWVAASGLRNVRRLSIGLGKGAERRYTVRLHFCEPDDLAAGVLDGHGHVDLAVHRELDLDLAVGSFGRRGFLGESRRRLSGQSTCCRQTKNNSREFMHVRSPSSECLFIRPSSFVNLSCFVAKALRHFAEQ
jgi:hypothetical protein